MYRSAGETWHTENAAPVLISVAAGLNVGDATPAPQIVYGTVTPTESFIKLSGMIENKKKFGSVSFIIGYHWNPKSKFTSSPPDDRTSP